MRCGRRDFLVYGNCICPCRCLLQVVAKKSPWLLRAGFHRSGRSEASAVSWIDMSIQPMIRPFHAPQSATSEYAAATSNLPTNRKWSRYRSSFRLSRNSGTGAAPSLLVAFTPRRHVGACAHRGASKMGRAALTGRRHSRRAGPASAPPTLWDPRPAMSLRMAAVRLAATGCWSIRDQRGAEYVEYAQANFLREEPRNPDNSLAILLGSLGCGSRS